MNPFEYRRGELFCEKTSLERIARRVGTPFYVYSANEIRARYRRIGRAFAPARPLVCYAVKANSNLSILRLLAREGSGFDIVSGGELRRVLRAGGDPRKIVFAGVGKTETEIAAALGAGVFLFNVESEEELLQIDRIAGRMGKAARVALRVNPDIDPKTHVFITTSKKENKFGVDLLKARAILRRAKRLRHLSVAGLHVHLGSLILRPGPYLQAFARMRTLFAEFPGGAPEFLDFGGGFGISYEGKKGLDVEALAAALLPRVRASGAGLVLEPGRFLVAPAGALVTRTTVTKTSGKKTFVIVDAGMNDLIRPSLYSGYHRIVPVRPRRGAVLADVVGPICESADFFAKDRKMPRVATGDLLAILDAGAYGFSMASHYNSRPNPPEVLVDGAKMKVVRKREKIQDLWRGEG